MHILFLRDVDDSWINVLFFFPIWLRWEMWHWTIINFWAGINTIENEIPIIGCDLLFSYNVGLKSNIVKNMK